MTQDNNQTNMLTDNKKWDIVRTFLNQDIHKKNKFLIKHQISSYEDFIEIYINKIIQDYNPVTFVKDNIEFCAEISNPRLTKAFHKDLMGNNSILMPNDALEKNLTYHSSLIVDVKYYYKIMNDDKIEDFKQFQEENVPIADIPIMIGSKYCMTQIDDNLNKRNDNNYENGGYFIIRGTEKVIISQEG